MSFWPSTSFGLSVGDVVATSQLCSSVLESLNANTAVSSRFSARANHELKLLLKSLSKLTHSLTFDSSRNLLARELFQKPLRNGLAQIRSDLEAIGNALYRFKAPEKRFFRSGGSSREKETQFLIDRISEENAKLLDLLTKTIFAEETTRSQEILSSLTTLGEIDNSLDDIKIGLWLAGSGQDELHTGLISQLEEETGSWILKDEGFLEWKDSSRNTPLWLWGIPGSGKSVLSAHIMESLRQTEASKHPVAFYHFTTSQGSNGSSLENCLMSLIGQFSQRESDVPDAIRKLYYDHGRGRETPGIQALQDTMLSVIPRQVRSYIVLDAIDECSKPEETLDVIYHLQKVGIEGLQDIRILVTSRTMIQKRIASGDVRLNRSEDHVEIEFMSFISIMVEPEDDIKRFIDHELNKKTGRFQMFPLELKTQVADVVSAKSGGMFLWACLALDRIQKAPTLKAVKKILDEPFPDLESMYTQMLMEIPPRNYEMVRRVLIWITNCARPLTAEELNEAVVLNTKGEAFSSEDKLLNSNEILKTCSSFLIQTTNNSEGRCIASLRVIHQSFIDFLRSKHTGPLPIDLQQLNGDRILVDCCITYILHANKGSPSDGDPTEFPLLAYAAEYWPHHAQKVEEARSWRPKTTHLIKRLFYDDNGNTLANWLNILNSATSDEPAESVHEFETPVFIASDLGLRHVLASLMEDETRSSSASELEAALCNASFNGNSDIVRLLLENGASPNAEHWSEGRPLDAAILKSHTTIVDLLVRQHVDVVKGNPFRTAVSIGDAAVMKLLLDSAVDHISRRTFLEILSQGLRDAARYGHLEMLQLLFNADATGDLDAADEAGWTALHYAIRYKHDEIQQYLIDHGADFDKRNLAGETPADFAWSDRRLDLSIYNNVIDLKKEARQAFSCHILQQITVSGECVNSVFRKTFKLKDKNRVTKPKARKAIIREHTILQRINHPFIVSYLWYEEDDGQETAQLYLEYCNGGDLDKFSSRAIASSEEESSSDESDSPALSGPSLTSKELWRYMFQVAAALAYLHHGLSLRPDQSFTFEKNWDKILHRDIKPSNIVLEIPQSGLTQAKLCDLGLAKGLNSKTKEAKETGGIGTRNYWPPEMFQKGGFWTEKGDIYSYGSTFDDLWTKSVKTRRDCHSPNDILDRCMSTQPADRPSSIELLEMTREHVAEDLPLATSSLHDLLGQSEAGYLHDALYVIAGQLDTKESYENRSVKVRRASLLKRLSLLCDDGAGSRFDAQPGSPNMRLHLAVLLNREAAFEQALEMPRATNQKWADSGWTPLHLAAQEGNVPMLIRLFHAADGRSVDAYNRFALSYCSTSMLSKLSTKDLKLFEFQTPGLVSLR